ncbi:MAG: TPM domain-containing protein [Prosthecobacter sp.]|nr:TPM domain-containing protein [Prosthecobacter sp.]
MQRLLLASLAALAILSPLRAEPPIPPKPDRYFNDYAKVVSPEVAQHINRKLEQFERDTSNQVLVAVFPKLPEGTYLEDFTVKAAQAWGAGGKEKDNGIILFVFIADRKLRIEVGYGLEGVVPDMIAASIIRDVIQPRFKQSDYAGGLDQGVEAIFKATRGEYKGTGRTLAEGHSQNGGGIPLVLFLVPALFIFVVLRNLRKTLIQGSHGRTHPSPWWMSSGGGSFGGGGGFSSGGGGFSGGGGSFGGGGASGGW